MKRLASTITHNYHTRSNKRLKLSPPLPFSRQPRTVISASHVYNYMINDPLIDWLRMKNRIKSSRCSNYDFKEFIMMQGIKFESKVVSYINSKILPVVSVSKYITKSSCKKTIELMMNGTPVIHSSPVKNQYNSTQGVIDLLVRSDYLKFLVDICPLTESEQCIAAPKLNGNYHYVVIDVKFSTLPLRSDGKHILNTGNYPAYKSQTFIYNEAIGHIQGYTSPYTFILGRRWRYRSKSTTYHHFSCLNRLGVINFDGVDRVYRSRTRNALKWLRDLNKHGHTWSAHPPSRPELYPNMCVDSGQWNSEKQKIAEDIDEMTTVWHVGVKHRNAALLNGVKNWRDARCTAKIMNFNGQRASTIDKMLAINRQEKDKIRPKIIQNNVHGWKRKTNEIYVDFETVSDVFSKFDNIPFQKKTDMIFMIGVGWQSDDDTWQYDKYICNSLTPAEEFRIMVEFNQFVSARDNPKIYYWYAESKFWDKAVQRQLGIAEHASQVSTWAVKNWCDLIDVFKTEPIVIKDCFKFDLKTIAKCMKKHNMIDVCLESKCATGLTAMINAWKCYNSSRDISKDDVFKDIIKYNEFDCKVLWDILHYLRENHVAKIPYKKPKGP